MDATTVAVDLAKDIFEVAVANRGGRVVERKRLTRAQFGRFLDGLAPGTEVIMEACGTAHSWGRRCQTRDLRPRLLPVQYVRPYVRRGRLSLAATGDRGRISEPRVLTGEMLSREPDHGVTGRTGVEPGR